ncbi:unnamed protein product [Arctia plantaginis]|uniref:Uncharacterized protein n=1 Tax=Arctia plantaginis TaxID=874455 RepID=A0A8S0Z0U9_ARCPL|nr:unnamed protein product [Arctia plantaginis]
MHPNNKTCCLLNHVSGTDKPHYSQLRRQLPGPPGPSRPTIVHFNSTRCLISWAVSDNPLVTETCPFIASPTLNRIAGGESHGDIKNFTDPALSGTSCDNSTLVWLNEVDNLSVTWALKINSSGHLEGDKMDPIKLQAGLDRYWLGINKKLKKKP